MTSHLWRRLNGVFCIYKPPMLLQYHAKQTIIKNLISDLNKHFIPQKENLIIIEGSTASTMEVKIREKFAVHPLSIGEGFEKNDVKINFVNSLAPTSSGVCVVGINKGMRFATLIKKSNMIRTYRLNGILGKATLDLHFQGRVKERSTYSHVRYSHLETVLMTIQAVHQNRAMQFLGGNKDSQGAYEALAEEGLVRPSADSDPFAYSLKCLEFNPPFFTVELCCINEDEYFLRKTIHDIGLMLKTNATTSKVRCIRYGPFTVDDALLRKHWRLDYVIDNIKYLRPRISEHVPQSPSLQRIEYVANDRDL